MDSQDPGFEVGKFYTGARRVKQLLGKLPDGTYIIGGPYTLTQGICGIVTFLALIGLRQLGLWKNNIIIDLVVILAISIAVLWLTGFIPSTRRRPTGVITGFIDALTSSRTGVWKGRALPKTFSTAPTPKKERHASAMQDDGSTATNNQSEESNLASLTGIDLLRKTMTQKSSAHI